MSATQAGPIEILLVEDDPDDVFLTREAFQECKLANGLSVVTNGGDALRFLRRGEGFRDSPRPHMILLDLNLPGKSGAEVLSEIKSDEALKDIPVIVLTTSHADEDMRAAYRLHANCFITKPVDLSKFIQIVRQIHDFWFTIVSLPSRGGKAEG